jgi:hypothetical protein
MGQCRGSTQTRYRSTPDSSVASCTPPSLSTPTASSGLHTCRDRRTHCSGSGTRWWCDCRGNRGVARASDGLGRDLGRFVTERRAIEVPTDAGPRRPGARGLPAGARRGRRHTGHLPGLGVVHRRDHVPVLRHDDSASMRSPAGDGAGSARRFVRKPGRPSGLATGWTLPTRPVKRKWPGPLNAGPGCSHVWRHHTAVAVGFEPTEGLHPHTLSRRAP